MKVHYLPLLILLTSCEAIKQARKENKIEKSVQTLKKYDVLDSLCADEFPADTTTKSDTKTEYVYDTLWHDGIAETVWQDSVKVITIPKYATITKTVKITTTYTVNSNKAEVSHLKDQVKDRDKKIIQKDVVIGQQEDKIQGQRKQIWILYGIITLLLLYIFRKPIGAILRRLIRPL